MGIPKLLLDEDCALVEELIGNKLDFRIGDSVSAGEEGVTAYRYGRDKIRVLVAWIGFNDNRDHQTRVEMLDLPKILPKDLFKKVRGNVLCRAPDGFDGPLMDMLWDAYSNPSVEYEKDRCAGIKAAYDWASQRVAGAGCRIRRKVVWTFVYDPTEIGEGWRCELRQTTEASKYKHQEVWTHHSPMITQESAALAALQAVERRGDA